MREGKHAELESRVNRSFELAPEHDRNLECQSLQAFTRDDEEAQARVTEELRRAKDSTLVFAVRSVSIYANNFPAAQALARLFTEPSR